MHDQETAQHIASLQARMNRMESQMQQLLLLLTNSQSHMDQTIQMQAMLQELNYSPNMPAAVGNQATIPQQEQPEIVAIRRAVLSGDKIKAIKLYRELYRVDLRTAKNAVESM